MGAWMNHFFYRASNLFTPSAHNNKNTRDTFFYKTGSRKPFEKSYRNSQQRLDDILDKINAKGFHSLTDEEKEFLQQVAKDSE
jgi:type IV secretory pathway VirB4 component